MLIPIALAFLLFPLAHALTLYNGRDSTALVAVTASSSATPSSSWVPGTQYTGLAAYDPTTLTPPPPPQPPTKQVAIAIPINPSTQGYALSIKQKGNFLGFSIELSVAMSVMGHGPGNIKPVFLNYMANIQNRAGVGPVIRVGGNTQEKSTLFAGGLPDGGCIQKVKQADTPTNTPTISYSPDLLYTLANISNLVGTEWYFGLAFNQSSSATISDNVPLAAGYAQKILEPHLRGLALGNEPDLYVRHAKRAPGWNMTNYLDEFNTVRDKIMSNSDVTNHMTLLGPSVCCNVEGFDLEDVLSTSWLQDNIDYLAAVTVQRYPNNNCAINGKVIDPQVIFTDFLNHTSAQLLTSDYLVGSAHAQAKGKEMLMLEFNSASCGGFPGLSDSFGAALWLTDWALQLAWGNFSAALLHVGGQNVYYNPFTPPPYEQVGKQWTTGSIYYSTLVVAEAFGRTGTAQVVDLLPGVGDMYHPAYVVYEHGVPSRIVLFNYVSDPSGASTYNAVISLTDLFKPAHTAPVAATSAPPATPGTGAAPGTSAATTPGAGASPGTDAGATNAGATTDAGATTNPGTDTGAATDPGTGATTDPGATADTSNTDAAAPPSAPPPTTPPVKRTTLAVDRVHVRYLLAPSVAEQYNITWAGQTLGYSFSSDGRMYGERETQEWTCTGGVCVVPVPAPAIAIIYLTPEALNESTVPPEATSTYLTTVIGTGTATIDVGAKATGNGFGPPRDIYGSTSRRKTSSAERAQLEIGVGVLGLAVALLSIGLGV